jgi:hypothetical protein
VTFHFIESPIIGLKKRFEYDKDAKTDKRPLPYYRIWKKCNERLSADTDKGELHKGRVAEISQI